MSVTGDTAQNFTDTILHRAHNRPLLPFSLPAPSHLLFPAHPSPQQQPPLHRSPAANMPSPLCFSPTWQKPKLGSPPPCLLCVCTCWQELPEALAQQLSWNHRVILSTSARLSFPTREILMCGPTHLSSFSQMMSVSDFLHKPQTSSSHSHVKNENNPGNYPNARCR